MKHVILWAVIFLSASAFLPPRQSARIARTHLNYHDVRTEVLCSEKPVRKIENKQTFKNILEQKRETVVVVKFYALRCQACIKMAPKFRQVSQMYPAPHFEFAEVELKDNEDLFEEEQVGYLPSVHFYWGGSKVENFTCSSKAIYSLKEKLAEYDAIQTGSTYTNYLPPNVVVQPNRTTEELSASSEEGHPAVSPRIRAAAKLIIMTSILAVTVRFLRIPQLLSWLR